MRMNPDKTVIEYRRQPHERLEAVTPTEALWVLAHMGLPDAPQDAWTLEIGGLAARPLALTLEALRRRPRVEVEAVLNCAGSPMRPTVPTRQAANLRWAGASLRDLLAEAGALDEARYLWASGADHGVFAGRAAEEYRKDSPLARFAEADALVAWELNGAPIPLAHGGPVRLVIPGFYATNSVKWLTRLDLAAGRAPGVFSAELYNDPPIGDAPAGPVWAIRPDSAIVAPEAEARVGEEVEIWGWAWGDTPIVAVEVSLDGGATWGTAAVDGRRDREWQRFSYRWRPEAAGAVEIVSRAWDAGGRAQPLEGARNEAFRRGIQVLG